MSILWAQPLFYFILQIPDVVFHHCSSALSLRATLMTIGSIPSWQLGFCSISNVLWGAYCHSKHENSFSPAFPMTVFYFIRSLMCFTTLVFTYLHFHWSYLLAINDVYPKFSQKRTICAVNGCHVPSLVLLSWIFLAV